MTATNGTTPYPSSHWKSEIHPREPEVTAEVDGYFLQHWPFPDEKARKKYVAAGFPRVTCFYFPKALDDRIHYACRLLTVLFLIDGKSSYRSIHLPPWVRVYANQ